MSDTFVFPKRDDNSTEDAEKLVKWARQVLNGEVIVEANIVFDYITVGSVEHGNLQAVPGALNGVTLQWDHDGDGNPDGAVHAPAGSTITRLKGGGFQVEFTQTRELPVEAGSDELVAVVSQVVRTKDTETVQVVPA